MKTSILIALMLFPTIILFADENPNDYGFKNPDLKIEERVADLIGRLSLEEKISLLNYQSPAIERLGIPAYTWWSEALHGLAGRSATVFPQAIGMAATFDPDLVQRISTAISDEARAQFHAMNESTHTPIMSGLTFWSPNINLFRDPRWGRGQETWGEDPFLTGTMGAAFIKGLQGDHPKYLKAAACAKHFIVHSGPEKDRHHFNAVVSEKDFYETYAPAFKMAVDAGVEAVMCAYNRTNDEPCCGSNTLLKKVLRNQWGFKGHIVSDCWAIGDIDANHKVTASPEESAAIAIKNGVNVNCGDNYRLHLKNAVEAGLVTEAEVEEALRPLLRTRIRLGLFDPPGLNPYEKIPVDVIDCDAHRQLAREAAQKSVVLLKNNGVLPIGDQYQSFYVIGPTAASVLSMLGNYNGINPKIATIVEGIASKLKPGQLIEFKQGILLDRPNVNPIDWFSKNAKNADICLAVFGINNLLEGEEGESHASADKGDRSDIGLPPHQLEYLKKLRENNTKPLVVILTGGSPLAIPEVEEIADAVLFVWYPGEEGGNAVADILFGDAVPSGKLPLTFPKSTEQLPPYDDYSMTGRTYRYMQQEPLYPFGFGLSYTTFEYGDLKLSSQKVKKGNEIVAEVLVKNAGSVAGEEVVQLYLSHLNARNPVPLHSLKAFKRIHLEPGEATRVSFTITPEMMQLVNDDGKSVLVQGKIRVAIGGCSPGKRTEELLGAGPMNTVYELK